MRKILTGLSAFGITTLMSSVALAQETPMAKWGMWLPVAVAIAIGLAALGGALGQSRVGAAAVEGIARNPTAADKLFVPMLLGLAFIESLVLFTWVLMLIMLFI